MRVRGEGGEGEREERGRGGERKGGDMNVTANMHSFKSQKPE